MSFLRPTWFVLMASLLSHAVADIAFSQTPLHQRIDQHIQKNVKVTSAARSSDAEFLRRIYLNLTGVIPPVEDTRAFLADPSTDKRVRLVDKLLASENYASHMTNLFDVLLMDRRADKHVKHPEWREFL